MHMLVHDRMVRPYAFCAKDQEQTGGIVLMVVNLHKGAVDLSIALDEQLSLQGKRYEFSIHLIIFYCGKRPYVGLQILIRAFGFGLRCFVVGLNTI